MKIPAVWTVYLLHFERPVGRSSHYIGITRTSRLTDRMREHGHGRGSGLTSRAAKAGVKMWLCRTWETNTVSLERSLKASGHHNQKCPICSAPLDGYPDYPQFSALPAYPANPDWQAKGWGKQATE